VHPLKAPRQVGYYETIDGNQDLDRMQLPSLSPAQPQTVDKEVRVVGIATFPCSSLEQYIQQVNRYLRSWRLL
jgi:hypothetical protein